MQSRSARDRSMFARVYAERDPLPLVSVQPVVAKTAVSPATVTAEEDLNSCQSKTALMLEKVCAPLM